MTRHSCPTCGHAHNAPAAPKPVATPGVWPKAKGVRCGTCKSKAGHVEGCAFAVWNRAELLRLDRAAASDPHVLHIHWLGVCRVQDDEPLAA